MMSSPASRSSLRSRVILLVAAVVVALGLVEITLRVLHFSPGQVNAGYLQFGYRTGIPTGDEDGVLEEDKPVRMLLFRPHPELLWETIPDTPLTNSRGFRGKREYPVPKPPGVYRIVVVGDSCSFLGGVLYPEILEVELNKFAEGRSVECVNASVPGFTVFQGRRLLEQVRDLGADMVIVYFGWNDHWKARGNITDREQHSLGHGLRTVALVRAWLIRLKKAPANRVPLDEFRSSLAGIRDTVLARGGTPVFITAPSNFDSAGMPAWSYQVFSELHGMTAREVDAVPSLHSSYAEAVREAARHPGALLVDAERIFASNPFKSRLFRNDRIHLRDLGHALMAESVLTVLRSQGLP